jgi:hypothetical protein
MKWRGGKFPRRFRKWGYKASTLIGLPAGLLCPTILSRLSASQKRTSLSSGEEAPE